MWYLQDKDSGALHSCLCFWKAISSVSHLQHEIGEWRQNKISQALAITVFTPHSKLYELCAPALKRLRTTENHLHMNQHFWLFTTEEEKALTKREEGKGRWCLFRGTQEEEENGQKTKRREKDSVTLDESSNTPQHSTLRHIYSTILSLLLCG